MRRFTPFFKFSTLASKIAPIQTSFNNLNPKIISLADRHLLKNKHHPLGIICNEIKKFFEDPKIFKSDLQNKHPKPYVIKDEFLPIVSTKQNFDDLLVPPEHVSRRKSDTYYVNETTVLRTHTSAHQTQMLKSNISEFCVFGNFYFPEI
jgi:phenylalanyl-tRNA synthetase alpha chain